MRRSLREEPGSRHVELIAHQMVLSAFGDGVDAFEEAGHRCCRQWPCEFLQEASSDPPDLLLPRDRRLKELYYLLVDLIPAGLDRGVNEFTAMQVTEGAWYAAALCRLEEAFVHSGRLMLPLELARLVVAAVAAGIVEDPCEDLRAIIRASDRRIRHSPRYRSRSRSRSRSPSRSTDSRRTRAIRSELRIHRESMVGNHTDASVREERALIRQLSVSCKADRVSANHVDPRRVTGSVTVADLIEALSEVDPTSVIFDGKGGIITRLEVQNRGEVRAYEQEDGEWTVAMGDPMRQRYCSLAGVFLAAE